MNIFNRSEIKRGDVVAIVGVGFLGSLLIQLAVDAGAHVIAISCRAYSLDVVRTADAHEVIEMRDHWELIEQVRSLTEGRFCDVVVEAVGKQWPLDLAGELTRERGRLVIAGYHQDGPRQVNMQMWNWRGLDVINAHERDPAVYVHGIREAIYAVASGRLDPAPFPTHEYPLAAWMKRLTRHAIGQTVSLRHGFISDGERQNNAASSRLPRHRMDRHHPRRPSPERTR